VHEQVEGAQGETDPASLQTYPAVARAHLQVVAKQSAQLVEDAGLDRRVQAVAAEVDPVPGHGHARRGAPEPRAPLQQRHPVPVARGAVGGAHPGRAPAQNQQIGVVCAQVAAAAVANAAGGGPAMPAVTPVTVTVSAAEGRLQAGRTYRPAAARSPIARSSPPISTVS